MKLADVWCVELSVEVKCTGCGELVAVNGPRPVARCPGCDVETILEGPQRWREVLSFESPAGDVFKVGAMQKEGATQAGGRGAVKLSSTRAWPKCTCGRRFEATKLAGTIFNGGLSIACPTCTVEVRVDRPPLSFRKAFPAALALVGAEIVPDVPDVTTLKPKTKPPTARTPWWALFDRSKA